MTQPPFSGAPTPVSGVTGGPAILGGQIGNDPTSGNVVISPNPGNATQIRKSSTPQAFQVYEYFNTNTDYSRISLNTQTGGDFQLAVETAPSSVIRNLQINAGGNIQVTAGNSFNAVAQTGGVNITSSAAGVSIQAQTSIGLTTVTSHMILTVQGVGNRLILKTQNLDRWHILDTGHLVCPTDNTYDIGQAGATRPRNIFCGTSVQTGGKAGVAVDGDVVNPADGQLRYDSTNNRLYIRIAGVWRYATLT